MNPLLDGLVTPAPYVDPDGFPSWQPAPNIRAMDARRRRERMAQRVVDAEDRLEAARIELERAQLDYQEYMSRVLDYRHKEN